MSYMFERGQDVERVCEYVVCVVHVCEYVARVVCF